MWWALPAATALSGISGSLGQRSANRSNERIARENRDFQERMSSTSYQRAMADMKAAGLNPMLAGKVGGASSPSGSTATMVNEMGPAMNSAAKAADQATVLRRQNEEIKNMRTQRENIMADTGVKAAQANLQREYAMTEEAKRSQIRRENMKVPTSIGLMKAQTTGAEASAESARARAAREMEIVEWLQNFQPFEDLMKQGFSEIFDAKNKGLVGWIGSEMVRRHPVAWTHRQVKEVLSKAMGTDTGQATASTLDRVATAVHSFIQRIRR